VHSRKETAKTARFAKDSALKEDKLARFVKADRCGCEAINVRPCIVLHSRPPP